MKVEIRPLAEADIEAAEHVCRLAFGTFFGLPDPISFRGDGALVRPRYLADPSGALVAETGDGIVGSGLVTNWGSVGLFGPLTVHPDRWSSGIGRRLTEALLDLLDSRGHDFAGLLTHPQSTRHVRLYESFGFEVQRPISVLRRELRPAAMPDRARLLADPGEGDACREVADAVWPGLDHTREISSVLRHGLGDTVLLARPDGGERAHRLCGLPPRRRKRGQFGPPVRQGRGGEAGSRPRRRTSTSCSPPARRWPPGAAQTSSPPAPIPAVARSTASCASAAI